MRILILSFFLSLSLSVQAAPSTNWQSYGVILKGQQAKKLLTQCSRVTPQKVTAQWTPSTNQIEQLERKLSAFKQKLKRPAAQLSNFYRRYAGFIAGGRKIIYVDFLPKRFPFDWRIPGVMVCDGGESFWGVEFEVSTGKFVNAEFSGVV
jgi:hypothetical protein